MAGLIGRATAAEFEPSADINVTPLIDVMLVLLLVFMIAAPISTSNVPVDLPSASAKPSTPPEHQASVTIRNDLSVFVDDRRVTAAQIAPTLRTLGATPSSTIFLRIDKRVAYGESLAVLDALRNAGFVKVALVGLNKE